jgi:hypothetical protein
MNYNLTEQQLKDLMHRSWLKAKKFYKGQTDEYFYDFYDAEIKQLIIGGVVGQSEQLPCEKCGDYGIIQDEHGNNSTCTCHY